MQFVESKKSKSKIMTAFHLFDIYHDNDEILNKEFLVKNQTDLKNINFDNANVNKVLDMSEQIKHKFKQRNKAYKYFDNLVKASNDEHLATQDSQDSKD
jgi:hypothetical protein